MSRRCHSLAAVLVVLAAALGGLASTAARGQTLVADLSSHLVSVTAGFAGTDLLLFGSAADEGDVIVVVRGPDSAVVVRRKMRSPVGIWVNRDEAVFSGVPSFYRIASSRPLDEFQAGRVLEIHQIGVSHLEFAAEAVMAEAEEDRFRQALIRNKQRQGLFADAAVPVTFLGERLFRARVAFPSNVPTGTYTVTVYLVRAGKVVSAQTIPLVVSKIGVGARIYDFAYQQAALYGLFAILIALFAGWFGSAVFRKI
ncbi:MAG: TIGR02186 family protein [Alphaproteobacteria bacterium]|jgi:uncharacterized protein (TIGR02186 family)|nr:TIGR02186 family protein [Alphaproteobacteria bacterium]